MNNPKNWQACQPLLSRHCQHWESLISTTCLPTGTEIGLPHHPHSLLPVDICAFAEPLTTVESCEPSAPRETQHRVSFRFATSWDLIGALATSD